MCVRGSVPLLWGGTLTFAAFGVIIVSDTLNDLSYCRANGGKCTSMHLPPFPIEKSPRLGGLWCLGRGDHAVARLVGLLGALIDPIGLLDV